VGLTADLLMIHLPIKKGTRYAEGGKNLERKSTGGGDSRCRRRGRKEAVLREETPDRSNGLFSLMSSHNPSVKGGWGKGEVQGRKA